MESSGDVWQENREESRVGGTKERIIRRNVIVASVRISQFSGSEFSPLILGSSVNSLDVDVNLYCSRTPFTFAGSPLGIIRLVLLANSDTRD